MRTVSFRNAFVYECLDTKLIEPQKRVLGARTSANFTLLGQGADVTAAAIANFVLRKFANNKTTAKATCLVGAKRNLSLMYTRFFLYKITTEKYCQEFPG